MSCETLRAGVINKFALENRVRFSVLKSAENILELKSEPIVSRLHVNVINDYDFN